MYLNFNADFYQVDQMLPGTILSSSPLLFHNVEWSMCIERCNGDEGWRFYLDCQKPSNMEHSSITIKARFSWPKSAMKNFLNVQVKYAGKINRFQFLHRASVRELTNFMTGDCMHVNMALWVIETFGIKKNLEDFSQHKEGLTNAVLTASGAKFHVNKEELSLLSPRLRRHFSVGGNGCYEAMINGFNACAFQNFLEMRGENPVVDDWSVCGVLFVAYHLRAESILQICENYLMGPSQLDLTRIRRAARDYELTRLEEKICNQEGKFAPKVVEPVDVVTLD